MDILIKALIISLFCVGLRIISSPGMIFYFLRQPYEWAQRHCNILKHLLKPVIGCGTCMASVWTIAIELGYYNGTFNAELVIIAFIVAALNSLIYAYFEKITQ
jgi:coenzyme F420-reducing hydrogenase gamma subunit